MTAKQARGADGETGETGEPGRPPIPERPLIRGERIWLRPVEERDLPAYVANINDTEVGGPAGYRWPQSVEQARKWLARMMERTERDDGFYFAVCEIGDDRFIGTTWFKEINWLDGATEFAIFMDRAHIGSGWGTDVARTMVDFGFETLRLERIWLFASADNSRALRSYEKVGFVREGVVRKAVQRDGELIDGVTMAILREDWLAARQKR